MQKVFRILVLMSIVFFVSQIKAAKAQTYCNPLILSNQVNGNKPAIHDVSDPSVILYKDNYYLFASKSKAYWYSNDLLSWKSVTNSNIPLKNNCPTAVVIGEWLYFFTSYTDTIFRSNDPASGKWEVYNSKFLLSMITDPAVFADTDGRVYCYYGCTNDNRLMARELDVNNKLNPKGVPEVCLRKNPFEEVSKRSGDKTAQPTNRSAEGSWVCKYNGKYYYQSSEPGFAFKSYNDVVYVADKPLGPYTYASNNPISSKPGGFISGASRGSTFADKYGNWWHIATMSVKQSETRLGLFPAGFDDEGNLFVNTDFGDYPIVMPNYKYNNISELNPAWSLLSYDKKAEASSSSASNSSANAFDENIETYWCPQNGKKNEWLSVDLGSLCTINAFQLNFSENNIKLLEGEGAIAHQYLVEYSADKKNWKTLSDKTSNKEDLSHPYEAMKNPVQAQYVKITNHLISDGTFAISGFRIFGSGTNSKPTKLTTFYASRDFRDQRMIKLTWVKKEYVTGYMIRYGTKKDKLHQSYQVFKDAPVTFRVLDKNKTYWFEIDAFDENGVTPSDPHPSH